MRLFRVVGRCGYKCLGSVGGIEWASNLVIGRRGTFALSPNIFTTGSPIRKGNVLTNPLHLARQNVLPSAQLFFNGPTQGVTYNGFLAQTAQQSILGLLYDPSLEYLPLKDFDRECEVNHKLNYY